jgi:RNA polymerase sigma-70 factor (ECF subfamily)
VARPADIAESHLLAIHTRLLDQDPTAAAVLVDLLSDPLCDKLKRHRKARRFRHLISDAVEDALVSYIKRPEQYQPAKRGLWGYLAMAATGDLLNAIEMERRTLLREKPVADVEHGVGRRNRFVVSAASKSDAEGPEYRARVEELRTAAHGEFTDPRDREVAELMIGGISDMAIFAAVLGIEQLPVRQQRVQVKRCKDRVSKRLQRLGKRLRETR